MYVDAENAISMFWEWFNWTEISNVGELIDVEYHAIHAGWTINDIVVYREKSNQKICPKKRHCSKGTIQLRVAMVWVPLNYDGKNMEESQCSSSGFVCHEKNHETKISACDATINFQHFH